MTTVSPNHVSSASILPITVATRNGVTPNITGPDLDFVRNEILRLGAPPSELRSVRAFLASDMSLDPRAYDALPPRMRRLVDLATVAGHALSAMICDGDKDIAV